MFESNVLADSISSAPKAFDVRAAAYELRNLSYGRLLAYRDDARWGMNQFLVGSANHELHRRRESAATHRLNSVDAD